MTIVLLLVGFIVAARVKEYTCVLFFALVFAYDLLEERYTEQEHFNDPNAGCLILMKRESVRRHVKEMGQ